MKQEITTEIEDGLVSINALRTKVTRKNNLKGILKFNIIFFSTAHLVMEIWKTMQTISANSTF